MKYYVHGSFGFKHDIPKRVGLSKRNRSGNKLYKQDAKKITSNG